LVADPRASAIPLDDGASTPGAKVMTAPVFGRAFTERLGRLGWTVRRRMVHGLVVYDGLAVGRPPE